MKGIFTISLDFELHWGGFEKWPLQGTRYEVRGTRGEARGTRDEVHGTRYEGVEGTKHQVRSTEDYTQYFLNTREVIPEMLALFEKYEVHVTWATVGMLFHESRAELLSNAPALKPSYKASQLSAYNFINHQGIGDNELSDPFHFAPSLLKQIIDTPNQEIGTHTYAHFYCNEEGQTVEQFVADLRAAKKAAAKYGKKLSSLVFPRNQFNEQYLRACFNEGIRAVRSNPLDWFWHIEGTQDESWWKRLNRGRDAYLPLGRKNTYTPDALNVVDGMPVCIPASRLLRPYRPKELFLNSMKIARIKSEMSRAARLSEIYHLWWHPHNFGHYPAESLLGLQTVLEHYRQCKKQWTMSSLNMGEISEKLLARAGVLKA